MQLNALRIAYLSGPVNAMAVYESWTTGRQLGYFGSSHITQFFELCTELGAEGYVITTLGGVYSRRQMGNFVIENRPMPMQLRGFAYHCANAFWLVRLMPAVIRFRPHFFVITAAANYWFLLSGLKLLGIKMIPALTCTLWPKFAPLRMPLRILRRFNSFFFSHAVVAVIAHSEDIARQVRSLISGKKIPIATFLPIYPRSQFAMFRPADLDLPPIKVFFGGRIETNKGVYDLVAIARLLEQRGRHRFHFDICGDGSQLQSLQHHIASLGLTEMMTCHGFCERSKLSALLQDSHIVIVPTTTQFEEGFNMVCAEAILAGRPLITSAVCPALEYVREAAIEVPPDDVAAYTEALLALANDRGLYERKRAACGPLQQQFYEVNNDWGPKLREVLSPHLPATVASHAGGSGQGSQQE